MAAEEKIPRPIFGGCAESMTATLAGAADLPADGSGLQPDRSRQDVMHPDRSVMLRVVLATSSAELTDDERGVMTGELAEAWWRLVS